MFVIDVFRLNNRVDELNAELNDIRTYLLLTDGIASSAGQAKGCYAKHSFVPFTLKDIEFILGWVTYWVTTNRKLSDCVND